MKINICPVCKSTKINYYAGALTGQYHCDECGYIGAIILEEEIEDLK